MSLNLNIKCFRQYEGKRSSRAWMQNHSNWNTVKKFHSANLVILIKTLYTTLTHLQEYHQFNGLINVYSLITLCVHLTIGSIFPIKAFVGDSPVSPPWGSFMFVYVHCFYKIWYSPQAYISSSETYWGQKHKSFLKQWVQKRRWSPCLLQGMAFLHPWLKQYMTLERNLMREGKENICSFQLCYPHTSF